ncbi:MAG TPA: PCRF domain-containing protein [Candidatus Azoamicus sp. OHIO2]
MIYDIFELLEQDYLKYEQLKTKSALSNNSKNKKDHTPLQNDYYKLKKKLNDYILYKNIALELANTTNFLNTECDDLELKNLAINEIKILEEKKLFLKNKISSSINIINNNNHESIFFELRAASGGNEASIFVEDLFKMYTSFFNNKKWHYKIIASTKGNIAGYKDIILKVTGINVNVILKNETGIHRVQRVPITETHDKIQTSTCSIAILPDITNINDIELNPNDIRIDTFRSSGAGGQHVNMTDSAVRIIHIPTNTVVECQNERSQHKNKHTALTLLKSRLLIKKQQEQKTFLDKKRKIMIGTGERSEKIRTYNYITNRVTDHKHNITSYRLKNIIDGNLNIIIDQFTNCND